ncbi:MAG: thiamine pyrophosphate protein domain-containing protein, partial [Methylocystaceae bacterium]
MHLGVDFILEALAREGLDHVFMVPGGLVDPFLPALGRQEALTPIVAAQEGGAAYMADGYARASGSFGAAICIGGPGSDGSPLLLMSGEVATVLEGLGVFQDASPQTLDDVAIMKPLTRYSSSIDNPKNMPHLFEHALLQLRTRPAAPVHLSLPGDCLAAEISVTHTPIDRALIDYNALPMAAAESSLQHFLGSAGGKPPVKIAILAGAGVEHSNAANALKEFAETWRVPVATTLRGKGVFPENHPLSLGVFGYAGTHHSHAALMDPSLDLLIILGSGLNERDTMHWALQVKPSKTICVNLLPSAIGTHVQDGGIVGSCGAYLGYLLDQGDKLRAALDPT